MNKNQIKSKGIPLYVDDVKDLPAKETKGFDSWYVISSFDYEGKHYGFEWHQQTLFGKINTVEFLLMDEDRKIWSNNAVTEPISEKAGADKDKLHVYSKFGELSGNEKEMRLKLKVDDGAVDVTVRPRGDVLYNGTTGVLHFLGGDDSYEYGYFNMDIEGIFTLKGKTVPIANTTAWFDRQWGFGSSEQISSGSGMNRLAWLWLGMTLNPDASEAISLWDAYGADGRYTFATIYNKDKTQVNVPVDISYDGVWKSAKSGQSYPRKVNVSIPARDIEFEMALIPDDPEFFRENGGICGCQSLCHVTGYYKNQKIDRRQILEIIGDLCGEA